MKRYAMAINYHAAGYPSAGMVEHDSGDYVRYDDAAAEVARLEAENGEWESRSHCHEEEAKQLRAEVQRALRLGEDLCGGATRAELRAEVARLAEELQHHVDLDGQHLDDENAARMLLFAALGIEPCAMSTEELARRIVEMRDAALACRIPFAERYAASIAEERDRYKQALERIENADVS